MKKRLYRYAVLLHPTPQEEKKGEGETRVVVEPTPYALYADENAVMMTAIRKIPAELMTETARLEVAISPFDVGRPEPAGLPLMMAPARAADPPGMFQLDARAQAHLNKKVATYSNVAEHLSANRGFERAMGVA